ncbi:MAG: hypothetical protein RR842_09835 [Gordonibacter sp.]|uniref:hypothetical protein n=1 Tax=Gordonibacter sp. TaxID=1968902 RepID=UPI002FC9529F
MVNDENETACKNFIERIDSVEQVALDMLDEILDNGDLCAFCTSDDDDCHGDGICAVLDGTKYAVRLRALGVSE